MADFSDDDDDLFADDDTDLDATNISSNLLESLGKSSMERPVHEGDVDEGNITWLPPTMHGLNNSHAVNDSKGSHWYNESPQAIHSTLPATGTQPPADTGAAPFANMLNQPGSGFAPPQQQPMAGGAAMFGQQAGLWQQQGTPPFTPGAGFAPPGAQLQQPQPMGLPMAAGAPMLGQQQPQPGLWQPPKLW